MEEKNQEENKKRPSPAVLLIIDGWGVAPEDKDNPITRARTPYLDELVAKYPVALLKAGNNFLGKNYDAIGGSPGNISDILSEAGLRQLKISEAEKYAYLAYFLNGKDQSRRKGEDRILLKTEMVDDYAKKPAMATGKITENLIKAIKEGEYDLMAAAFANLDMVSYSEDKEAIEKAFRVIDRNIKRLTKAVLNKNGYLFIVSAKGGAENQGKRKKKSQVVPFIMISDGWEGRTTEAGEVPGSNLSLMKVSGDLSDIAPTILNSLNIENKLQGDILIR